MSSPNRILSAFAFVVLLTFTAAASAEPPMWVVKDKDSTVYLFGTVHLLDPDTHWLTPRVEHALEESTQLWEEIPMPVTLQELQAKQGPAILQRALSPNEPLSTLLNDAEKADLARALARTPNPQQFGAILEKMKPWFAILNLSVTPLMNAGFTPGAGADIVLSTAAHERGKKILGFETLEQQLDMISGWTAEQQLAALRVFLAVPDEEFDARITASSIAFRAWMSGDVSPLEAIHESWRTGADQLRARTMPYDVFVTDRNENWARQIEKLLAGSGVAFVAVGAGHMVGPESLQARLAARGIDAKPY